jgi:hypothetical protein
MNRRFASLAVAGLALAAAPLVVVSASPAHRPAGSVEILVDGVPQRQYAHAGRWYIEAHKGREYAIQLRNPYAVRVAVALAVDGINTIDGRHTTAAEARKWVLGPYETVTIRGWQTSRSEARRFEFTTEERSYAQALGQPANLGVISAVFFKERVHAVVSGSPTDSARSRAPAEPPAPAAPAAEAAAAKGASRSSGDEYAATGMGRRTGHAVTQVWLDLEDAPAHAVDLRYEFRPQLVRLGILPPEVTADPLQRRERAGGFERGFCPEPPRRR